MFQQAPVLLILFHLWYIGYTGRHSDIDRDKQTREKETERDKKAIQVDIHRDC